MICPRCGSNHIQVHNYSNTTVEEKQKGFGCIKACLGYLIFNVPGILCGLCGMGKGKRTTTTSIRTEYTCQDCGNRF